MRGLGTDLMTLQNAKYPITNDDWPPSGGQNRLQAVLTSAFDPCEPFMGAYSQDDPADRVGGEINIRPATALPVCPTNSYAVLTRQLHEALKNSACLKAKVNQQEIAIERLRGERSKLKERVEEAEAEMKRCRDETRAVPRLTHARIELDRITKLLASRNETLALRNTQLTELRAKTEAEHKKRLERERKARPEYPLNRFAVAGKSLGRFAGKFLFRIYPTDSGRLEMQTFKFTMRCEETGFETSFAVLRGQIVLLCEGEDYSDWIDRGEPPLPATYR